MHAHFYGDGLPEALRRREQIPRLVTKDDTETLWAMTARFPFRKSFYDIDSRLAYLDANDFDSQLITFPGALGLDVQPVAEVGDVLSAFNETLADICVTHPGRFYGLAGLPLADMDHACDELTAARQNLKLLGAILPANYFISIAALDSIRPLLARADDVGAHFLIHPGLCPGEAPPAPYEDNQAYRASAIRLQSTLSHVVISLLFSNILDCCPNITFQIVNLGGTIPFLFERMAQIADFRTPDQPFPTVRLKRLYYDCASMGPNALEAAVKAVGADQIMVGTDYPIFPGNPVRDVVDAASLTSEQRDRIKSGTARALINRFL